MSASKQGFEDTNVSVSVGANEKKPVSLTLAATAAPGMPGAGLGTGTDPGANGGTGGGVKPKTIALIAGAGLAVVGAGVGIAYHLRAGSAADDVDSLKAEATTELGRNCRDANETPKCAELSEAIDRRDDSRTIRNVGLIAGGVFAVATVITFFVWPDESRTEGSLLPAATVTRDSAGLSLSGSF